MFRPENPEGNLFDLNPELLHLLPTFLFPIRQCEVPHDAQCIRMLGPKGFETSHLHLYLQDLCLLPTPLMAVRRDLKPKELENKCCKNMTVNIKSSTQLEGQLEEAMLQVNHAARINKSIESKLDAAAEGLSNLVAFINSAITYTCLMETCVKVMLMFTALKLLFYYSKRIINDTQQNVRCA